MEILSSLVMRTERAPRKRGRGAARIAPTSFLMLLGAVNACGNGAASAMGPGPSSDAAVERSSGYPDATSSDTGGVDARIGAPDVPVHDATFERDAAIDAPTTPAADARTGIDANADDGRADTAADIFETGTADSGSFDTGIADASAEPPPNDAAGCMFCASYGPAEQAGRITNTTLNALSGIGASQKNPGVVYVHNDRNVARFFAVSEPGALLGTFTLTGASVEDIEDMAVAHCPAGSCVYLADIGGNISARTQFAVVRAPEPDVRVDMPGAMASLIGERLAFSYPDGENHNAESMFVDPNSDTIYIITKVAAGMPSAVYKLPATFGGAALTATKVADLTVPSSNDREATSASVHPCAPAFLLRTYNTLYEFHAPPGSSLEAAFAVAPVVVPVAPEAQGEGVTYRADGRGYFTTTEGAEPPLYRTSCP
jgi:hypothetical protein